MSKKNSVRKIVTTPAAVAAAIVAPLAANVGEKRAVIKAVLTQEMLELNASVQQTKWIDFAGTALCFFKRHVPKAPKGFARYVHLLRNVEGEAWMMMRAPEEFDVSKAPSYVAANEVKILGRNYSVYVSTSVDTVAGVLIDERGHAYKVVRCEAYDIGGASEV